MSQPLSYDKKLTETITDLVSGQNSGQNSGQVSGQVTGHEIERLMQILARLPGLGPRSARRVVLHLIAKRETLLAPLTDALSALARTILVCETCGNIDTISPCSVCQDLRRDDTLLVVVESVSDLWALERAKAVSGRYHVLGGTLSAIDGIGPDELNVDRLVSRVKEGRVHEVILALNATVEGETTAHFLVDMLQDTDVQITKLAHGVPIGGELDYLDQGTLATALRQRTKF